MPSPLSQAMAAALAPLQKRLRDSDRIVAALASALGVSETEIRGRSQSGIEHVIDQRLAAISTPDGNAKTAD